MSSRRFFAAAEAGNLAGLEALLANDVVLTGDGGGNVASLGQPVRGRSVVAQTVLRSLLRGGIPGVKSRRVEVNGGPGVV